MNSSASSDRASGEIFLPITPVLTSGERILRRFMESLLGLVAVHWDHEPADRAAASWTAPVLWRFRLARLHRQSARRLAHSKTWRGLPFCFLWLALGCSTCFGQWTNQTITLNPGWNAVYLEVEPALADCDVLFAGIAVESAWAWNRRYSTVQFIEDQAKLLPGQTDWLTWQAADQPARSTRNLFELHGGRAYLLKVKSGSSQIAWKVTGQPVIRQIDWLAN